MLPLNLSSSVIVELFDRGVFLEMSWSVFEPMEGWSFKLVNSVENRWRRMKRKKYCRNASLKAETRHEFKRFDQHGKSDQVSILAFSEVYFHLGE